MTNQVPRNCSLLQQGLNRLNIVVARLRGLFRRDSVLKDIEEEMRLHLEMDTQTNMDRGMNPDEARRAALRGFGNLGRIRDLAYEVRGGGMLETLWQDLHFAVHNIRKHALLSAIVVATLAMGIGVGTGVVTGITAVLLRARVDKDFDSFVEVYASYTTDPARPGPLGGTTLRDYLAFHDRAKSLREVAAYFQVRLPLGEGDGAEVRALLVTPSFFSVYDLTQPIMGRLLQPEDCSAAAPVVVLSEGLWRDRFEADPLIVGKITLFNGKPVTVVGVTPHFAGQVNQARAWFPYTLNTYLQRGQNLLMNGQADLTVDGRLNPGYSLKDASAELQLIASQQDQLNPGRTTALTVTNGAEINEPGQAEIYIPLVSLIMGAVTFIVLIVCANVVTLLLSRAAARKQEIAIRLALGAGRMRLIRMLLTETLLLASIAGIGSLYFAYSFPAFMRRWLVLGKEDAVSDWPLTPDWRAFAYLTLITIIAGTVAGLVPALQSLKVNLSDAIKGYQSQVAGAPRGSRLRGLLIGSQVALSFVLLAGGAIFLHAYRRASRTDPGFKARQVIVAELSIAGGSTGQRSWSDFRHTLAGRIEALPGVQSVAYASRPPFTWSGLDRAEFETPGGARRQVEVNSVSPNYFGTIGIPLLAGRTHGDGDRPCAPNGVSMCPVVVSQTLALEFWPNENALGKAIQASRGASFEVVGIVRDAATQQLGGPNDPVIYLPWAPNADADFYKPVVRFSGDRVALARALTTTIREMDPRFSVDARTIQDRIDWAIEDVRRISSLMALLFASAIFLAMIGIYGVVSFAVAQRTRELALRIVFGASKRDIYRSVFGSSVRPIVIGLGIGLVLTVAVTSVLEHFLRVSPQAFTVEARDPVAFVLAVILLAAAAIGAMLGPVLRATRVDPMVALRDQ